MKRDIEDKLLKWKTKPGRKPLILKGARQVGKTYLLKQFSATNFDRTHYINFEESIEARKLFAGDLSPERIIPGIEFFLNTTINVENDILILDEIQACSRALSSLKFFCEKLPKLAICAAGSLLGVIHSEEPFPVGYVEYEYLYPLTFAEFARGIEEKRAIRALDEFIDRGSVPEIAHAHMWDLWKYYLITGGLPEVVNVFKNFSDSKFTAVTQARTTQQFLIEGYLSDIAKHSGKINSMHIERVLRNVPQQLAKVVDDSVKRFSFKEVIPGISKYDRLVGPLDWLKSAGLLISVPIADRATQPLLANTKENRFKLYLFDVGILGALAGLPPNIIVNYDYATYKGYFAENFIAQELLARGYREMYGWHEGTAEVEFLINTKNGISPIEVKSGTVTRTKSLNMFIKRYSPKRAIIFSGKPLNAGTETTSEKTTPELNATTTKRYPLYLASVAEL